MAFALAKGDGGLRAFPSALLAAAHCTGRDVQDGAWLFFADDGSPLEARFERPDRQRPSAAISGNYTLQRALSGLWLQERLAQVRRVEGCGLATVADLVELLKINRGRRVTQDAKRK
jgi:hypothetical protein